MKKRVSLKDIAAKVGVSASLVSYVLNDQLENRINKETAEKIRRAAAEMHYQPNYIAKSLKNNKTQTIGLIVADIANPFSSSVARIIEDEAQKNNYEVIFGSADEDYRKAQKLIDVLMSRQVDGFIIAPPEGLEKQLMRLQAEDVPFVLIDRYFKALNVNYVAVDNFRASYNAVKHLIDNGFTRIGFINYQTRLIHLEERTRGYKEALRRAGLPVSRRNLKIISEANLEEEIQKAIDELIDRKLPADAVFFSSSNIAIEGLSYLRKIGIKIPDELGVICFDETKAYDLFQYPVTYIKQPLGQVGEAAVRLLIESINGRRTSGKIILATEMVVKGSSLSGEKRVLAGKKLKRS